MANDAVIDFEPDVSGEIDFPLHTPVGRDAIPAKVNGDGIDFEPEHETKLADPAEEKVFQYWKQQFAPNDSGADYDFRGAFKAGVTPDPQTGHWPDAFKKPNHQTFSDQSIYAVDRPELAGRWEGDRFIPPKILFEPDPIQSPVPASERALLETPKVGEIKAAPTASLSIDLPRGSQGERPPFAETIAGWLDAFANKVSGGLSGPDTLTKLVKSSTYVPEPDEPSFTNAGIPSVPQQEGQAAQVAAGVANIPIGFANFLLAPGGVATMHALGMAPKLAQTLVGAGFTAEQAHEFLNAKTTQEKVTTGVGALLLGVATAAGARGTKTKTAETSNVAPQSLETRLGGGETSIAPEPQGGGIPREQEPQAPETRTTPEPETQPVTFTPSAEWQEIPEGAVLPNGGEYQFDQATGKNYAKWSQENLNAARQEATSPATPEAQPVAADSPAESVKGGRETLIGAEKSADFAETARELLNSPSRASEGRYWTVVGPEGYKEHRFNDFAEAHGYMTQDSFTGERLVEHAPGEKDVTLPYGVSGEKTASRGQWTQSALLHLVETGEITEAQAKEAGLQSVAPNEQATASSARITKPPATSSLTAVAQDRADAIKAVEAVSANEPQKRFIANLSEQARASLGPGAASVEEFRLLRAENAREYAVIGASHLLEGKADKASWTAAMREEYGARDATEPELNKIWRDSHDVVSEFHAAQTGKALRPKAQIERATGIRPALASIKARLADSVTNAQALSGYLRGMERGSKLGASAREKQLAMADKWMAADQERVRQTLTEFVNATLPPFERGRYIGAITRALRRPALSKGDPGSMYRNAFRVMQAIENRSEDVHRGNLISDIKTISARILDSPSVDLAAKRILQRTVREINLRSPQKDTVRSLGKTREFLDRMLAAGKEVFLPKKVLASLDQLAQRPIKELPTTTIEDLHTKLRITEKIGRMRFKTRGAQWDAEKKMRFGEIQSGDGTPLEMRELFRPQPGERLTTAEKVRNWTARRLNAATVFDLGHLPVDVHFDLLQGGKGTYSGPLFDHIRNPVDAAYDRAQYRALAELEPLREIIKRNKLSDVDEDLIGLWAQLQQEGGEKRAMESGVTKATINKLKASGLTRAQKEGYDYMRGRLDATLPEVQSVMHDLFNIEVEAVEHYFPWMRDWESYKPSAEQPVFDARTGQEVSPEMLDSFGKLAGDFVPRDTAKLQRGFTIDRLEGAKTPIRTDSFDVFQRHMYAASRLIEMQRDLKMSGEIIRDDAFAKKFGAYGQRMLNQWLTAVATDGRGNNVHRMPLLDMARRGSNRALVFFRLTSNIKHLSAVPQAIVNAGGPEYYFRGLHATVSKEGTSFLRHFPQVTQRQAGDMSLQELQRSLGNTPSGIFPKGLALADRYGFILGKEIDALNSRAVFLGRYLRNLEDRGIKTGFAGPLDQAAAGNALAFMRRTVSSTLAKDVQPVLGRGQGFGGNVSIARALNAFRQYALERWSLLRYDTPAAFRTGNYTRGVALLAAAMAAGLYETNVGGAIRHAASLLAGRDDSKDKEHETWLQRLMVDGFSMVPYANNVISAVHWGQSGIPLVDNFVNAGKSTARVFKAKTDEGRKSAAIGAAGASAMLLGLPGSGVATPLVKDALVDKEKMKREARATHSRQSRLAPP